MALPTDRCFPALKWTLEELRAFGARATEPRPGRPSLPPLFQMGDKHYGNMCIRKTTDAAFAATLANAHDAMLDYIRRQTVHLLGDRVSRVEVSLRDHGAEIGICVCTPFGRRHAVRVEDWGWAANWESLTVLACEALVAWLDDVDTYMARQTQVVPAPAAQS